MTVLLCARCRAKILAPKPPASPHVLCRACVVEAMRKMLEGRS